MRAILSLIAVLLVAGSGFAQAERYELGQRLKAFEKQWDKTTDEKLKKKAAEGLPKLTGMFFTGQFGEAGRTLDEARWVLEGKQPTDDEKWAHSLYAVPDTRYVARRSAEFEVTIKAFYPLKTERPKNFTVLLSISGQTDSARLVIDALPTTGTLTRRMPQRRVGGDFALKLTVLLGVDAVAKQEIGVSFDEPEKGEGDNFDKIYESAQTLLKPTTLEGATVRDRAELLRGLAKGAVSETDIPAWALRQQVMEFMIHNQLKKDYFTPDRPGQFWLSIPTGKTATPARLYVPKPQSFIPDGEVARKPIPLVVALHGAGGSENMFFEGYGDGQILKLCQKRGWMLVSPRSALSLVGGGPPVCEIIDELSKRYPIDPKAIFIVGHSMGAMQAIDAVQKYPGKFAGLAAFGGDGRIRKPELFAELPTFLGVGDKDFTLTQVRKLKKTLEDAKAKALTYKEYEGLEHLLIVREALPDAFALFDTIVKK